MQKFNPQHVATLVRAPLALAVLAFAVGCHSAPPGPPRDYCFSPDGDDNATGTLERPMKSIGRANRLRLNPGDRLLFEGGRSFAGNLLLDEDDTGADDLPVQVASYGDGWAVIEAGEGAGVSVRDAGWVRVADLVVRGSGGIATGPPGRSRHSGVDFVNERKGGRRLGAVEIENVEVSGFGGDGISIRGDAPDRGPAGFDGVRIERCVARDNLRGGIAVTGETGGGVYDRSPSRYAHSNVAIRHCLVAGNTGDPSASRDNRSGSGIYLQGVENAAVEHCEAVGNGALNRSRTGGPVGIWASVSTGVTIQFCRSHRNRTGGRHDGGGFCLDGGVTHSTMQHNVSEENDGSGFGLYQYAGAPPARHNAVRHNLSRNDGRRNGYAGIHCWDGWEDGRGLTNVIIESNEVVTGPSSVAERRPAALWIQSPLSDAVIRNNRFSATDGMRLLSVVAGQRRVRFTGNEYHAADGAVCIDWAGRTYTDLETWRRASGMEPTPTPGV